MRRIRLTRAGRKRLSSLLREPGTAGDPSRAFLFEMLRTLAILAAHRETEARLLSPYRPFFRDP